MNKLAAVVSTFMALISIDAFAGPHMMDCGLHTKDKDRSYSGRGSRKYWNQNFLYTTQMNDGYFTCKTQTGKKLYLRFDGVGPGLGAAAWEGFKLVHMGSGSGKGTYYGARLQAAVGVGVNEMTAVQINPHTGRFGMIQVLGIDTFAFGVDPSLVRIVISDKLEDVRRADHADGN